MEFLQMLGLSMKVIFFDRAILGDLSYFKNELVYLPQIKFI